MSHPVRIAVVGCGRISQSYFQALRGIDEVVVAAVVEPRESSGRAAAEENHCQWLEDFRDPSLVQNIDAVIVSAPPNVHHPISKHFLERGRHVLCEKPFSLGSHEAIDLVNSATERERVLMMASKFRYVADVIKAKSIIEAGILGDIILYENTFCGRVPMADRWNSDAKIAGGGVLIDNGSHSADIARYLLGPVREVQAVFGPRTQRLDVEDTATLRFRTAEGVNGTIDLSWSINKEMDTYISVYGSEGTLHVGWKESRYRQEGNPNWISFGKGYDKLAALRGQITNFVGTIRGKAMPLITPNDGLASVQVIEAGYASANKDNWLSVESR
ncbi:MAG: Gfo/Idh/MocA family protein [Pirellulales bacterium]